MASYHHGNLRAALLDSAERMVEESTDLSLREVARVTGVSHGAPRQHFPDKRALLDALAARGFERLGAELEALVSDGPFDDWLVDFARTWVGFAVRHPALLDLMFASKNRADADAVREVADRAFAASSARIANAMGDLAETDHDRVAMAIFATVQGLAALVVSGMSGDRPVDVLVTDTVAILVDGLRPSISR
jgi:AcrR family transcriptional regulator